MLSVRAHFFFLAVSVAVVFETLPGRGQATNGSRFDVVMGLGLPAIDRGVFIDPSRGPGGPEAALRRASHARSTGHDLVGEGGARYLPGQVIVKFRDGVSSALRL